MDPFKCNLCKRIGDFVYKCANNHLVCENCVDAMDAKQRRCSCRTLLLDKVPNPLTEKIENPCRFEASGCPAKVTQAMAAMHESECDFRKVQCVVDNLKYKRCSWTGQNRFSIKHLSEEHFFDLGAPSGQSALIKVPFDCQNTFNIMRVIEARRKLLVFLYFSSKSSGKVRFLFVMMNKRSLADELYVKMRIEKDGRMINYETHPGCSMDSYEKLMAEENCIAITHTTIQHFVLNGHIHFSYSIKPQKCAV